MKNKQLIGQSYMDAGRKKNGKGRAAKRKQREREKLRKGRIKSREREREGEESGMNDECTNENLGRCSWWPGRVSLN